MSGSQSLVSPNSLHLGRKGGPPPPPLRSNAASEDKTRVSREKDRGRGIHGVSSCQSRVPLSSWTRGWS